METIDMSIATDIATNIDLARINAELGRNAEGLVNWAIGLGQRAIVTTNFRPFEAVILHMVTRAKRDVPVVWMDNGYNTEATYRFAAFYQGDAVKTAPHFAAGN